MIVIWHEQVNKAVEKGDGFGMYSLRYIVVKVLRKLLNHPAIIHSELDNTARCDVGCNVSYSKMGKYSYIGEYTSLSMVDVGAFTSISSGCTIGGGGHPVKWVSMSPVFQNSGGLMKKKFAQHNYQTHEKTYIGNDVWIGGDCLIRGGVHIADGAVIGMGSVVTHDIGPYEIWAGNPAKLIRKRFDDQTVNRLLEIQWWTWDERKLTEKAEFMNDMESFLESCK